MSTREVDTMNGAPFTIRERAQEDDLQIVEIFTANNPDRPPSTVEGYRHNLATIPPESGLRVVVAHRAGQVIGSSGWNKRLYSTVEESYRLNLSVHPATWDQGVGSSLYRLSMDDMQARGARRVFADVRE